MNIFRFELRRVWKSAVIWSAAIIAVMVLLMSAIYPVFLDSQADVEAMLAGFPPQFSAAFGMETETLFSYGGFFGFCFLYLSIMGAIMATALGVDIFSREKRAKCTDFIMVKPISRYKLFFSKLLAALCPLIIFNIIFIAASLIVYRSVGSGETYSRAALASGALFFTQLVMFAVSVFIAVYLKKIRSVSGIATAVGFSGFILTALYSILGEEALRYVAPYNYFSVSMAFSEGRFELTYVLTAAVLTLSLLAALFIKYCRGDVHAV